MPPALNTKLFLTWSGDRSRSVAKALKEWLPNVIQVLKPWMSEGDIEKGTKWASELSEQLAQTKIGIVCLTPENLDEPWVNFEAGALSKLPGSYVCTFLLGLSPGDVKFPLAQFQMTKAEKHDTNLLVQTINKNLADHSLNEQQLESAFDIWWPQLDSALKSIPPATGKDTRPKRPQAEMLEEILQLTRETAKASSQIVQSLAQPPALFGAESGGGVNAFAQLFNNRPSRRDPRYDSDSANNTLRMTNAAATAEEVAWSTAERNRNLIAAITANKEIKDKDAEK